MVNKTHAKRKRDIKTKLMAAICMLLVSSIMMVSTTYAWFTLSTAPEVTGINTAVGANGNLEIALLPKDGLTSSITSAVGDSVQDIETKNVTWGNLVDLRDSSVYGLDAITLYPAALNGNYDGDGYLTSIAETLLKTPAYGSDGRVSELLANTSNGYYNATEKNFFPNTDMGVRAVGTASGMTPRQLAYRNARSAASTAAASAKTVASQSLNSNGSTLANIAIKKGTGQDEFNLADLNSMKAIVDDLLGTKDADGKTIKTGALEHIETAYKNYILAYAASAAVATDMTQGESGEVEAAVQPWNTVQSNIDKSLAELLTLIPDGVSLPAAVSDPITKYHATLANVQSARSQLNTLIEANKATYTWDEIYDVLSLLANPDTMEVNGIKAGEIMQGDNMSDLVNSVASGGLKVTMTTGGGVYVDIADHCGDYTASVVIEQVEYNGLKLKNMTARMETKTTVKPNYLSAANTGVEAAGAPASGNTASQPITDMFGYVIDLAFRTNAAESKLLLQQDAVDRIYSDNANEGTMGHGSNMTFNTIAAGLNNDQIKNLMGAIRIVFFTPGESSNAVIMNAKLDVDNITETAEGGKKANLVLYKEKSVDGVITEEVADNNEIMNLPQNTAHQLSVLVYLDGSKVGNDDVAASAATSLVGQLNLQFASSATLVPMDYSQLHTPSTAAGE